MFVPREHERTYVMNERFHPNGKLFIQQSASHPPTPKKKKVATMLEQRTDVTDVQGRNKAGALIGGENRWQQRQEKEGYVFYQSLNSINFEGVGALTERQHSFLLRPCLASSSSSSFPPPEVTPLPLPVNQSGRMWVMWQVRGGREREGMVGHSVINWVWLCSGCGFLAPWELS